MAHSRIVPQTLQTPEWASFGRKLIPYVHETPAGIESEELPIFLLRGFLASHNDYVAQRRAIAQLGVASITMQSVSGVSEASAALAVMQDIQEKTGHNKFNFAPHSFGGVTAAELANDEAALPFLNNIVFIASACLTGHNIPQMAGRTVIFVGKDVSLTAIDQCRKDPRRFVMDNISRTSHVMRDIPRTWREGKGAATGNIQELLQGARNNDILTAALQFRADPYSRPREALVIAHLFEEVRVLAGFDHLALQKRPNDVAPVLLDMFANLQQAAATQSDAA